MKSSFKIRTSARQAAARQRIQQIDDPSGSAPPFEQEKQMANGWTINPGRREERRILEDMILHLQDDPTAILDAATLCFVYKEWPLHLPSMNTKATVKNVTKMRLINLKVEYIFRTQEDNDLIFWTDYTIEGLFNITPPPDTIDKTNMTALSGTHDSKSQLLLNSKTSNDGINIEVLDTRMNMTDDASSVSFESMDKMDPNPETPQQTWQREFSSSELDTTTVTDDDRKPPYKLATGVLRGSSLTSRERHTPTSQGGLN
jgi:hypothetical protein